MGWLSKLLNRADPDKKKNTPPPPPPAAAPVKAADAGAALDHEALVKIATDKTQVLPGPKRDAIAKMTKPKPLLRTALINGQQDNAEMLRAACDRFMNLHPAKLVFPMLADLSDDTRLKARTAAACFLSPMGVQRPDALRQALQTTEDTALIQELSGIYYRLEPLREICRARLKELAEKESDRLAETLSDREKAAYIKSPERSTAQQTAMLKQIRDDSVLADLLPFCAKDERLLKAAAETFRDGAALAEAARALEDRPYHAVYPTLQKKCGQFTPAFILTDPRAPLHLKEEAVSLVSDAGTLRAALHLKPMNDSLRLKIAVKLNDRETLTALALRESGGTLQKEAILALTDRDALLRVASESPSLHIRWYAASRLGDGDLIRRLESGTKPYANGHRVTVTDNRPWEHYCEQCIRCGAEYGHVDDSESTRHFGKPFSSFPCRPDVKPLG